MAGKSKNENFLKNYGGLERNDLTNILNCDTEIDDNSATIINISNYHDIEDIQNKPIFKNQTLFKVLSFNTESIFSKLDNIKLFLETLKENNIIFDALCINECWLDDYGSDLNLVGYEPFALTRITGTKGGLITYIQENYNVKDLESYSDCDSWEGQFLEISGNGLRSKLLLSNIYVPPRTTNDFIEFETNFFHILNNLAEKYKHIIIAGDTNADALTFNTNTIFREYFDKLTAIGLLPVITLPTHFGSRNGSIIDHIYIKTDTDLNNFYAGISLHTFSNHLPVFVAIPLKTLVDEIPKFINISKTDSHSWDNMINELNTVNWNNIFNTNNLFSNPCSNYDKFIDKIIQLKNKHMPTKKVRFKRYKHKNSDWITSGLLISIRQKNNLYKQLHSTQTNCENYSTLKSEYKKYEKNLKKLIRTVKKEYYNQQFINCQSDIKTTWQTIKYILNKNRSSRKMQTKFRVNGNIIEGDLKIAEEFNKFFSEIGPTLASDIRPVNNTLVVENFLTSNIEHSFSFNLTSPFDIQKIINNFKKKTSTGVDNINSIFIKKIQNFITYPLSILINQSISTGIFPRQLKISKITPLFKKNEDDIMNNYRPISLLPICSKIYEKVVQNQLYDYLENNNLIFESQHGFRKNYSTESAVIELTDYLKYQIDNQHVPLCLFLDLSKAFDTINFDIMLLKLRHLGINNMALNWFKSYLTQRQQFVSFNGTYSAMLETKTGVPQGSVLGPLLFLIYINDINHVSDLFKIICFADDSTLIVSICFSINRCKNCNNQNKYNTDYINQELDKIFNCFALINYQLTQTKQNLCYSKIDKELFPGLQYLS